MKSNQSVDLSFIQDTRFQLIRLYYIQKKIGASVRAAVASGARAKINDERASSWYYRVI